MIARKSALIILTQILSGILGYIGLKFIALYMDPWEYGVVGFAFGFVSLFSIFGTLGFDQAHIKKISEGKDLGRCIGTYIFTKIVLVGILASFTILSIFLWRFVLRRGFESPIVEQSVYIMLGYFVLFTITQGIIFTFNARKEIAKAQLPFLFFNIMRVIATIFVALNNLGPIALTYTYLFGEVFQFTFSLILIRKYPFKKPSFEYFKDYLKFAFPVAIASASVILMTNIDKVFIQLFWSSKEVGEYFACYNLSHYLIFFSNAVGLLLFPTISEYHEKRDLIKIKGLIIKSERYLSMIVFPIILLIIILAEPIIHVLLSDKYLPALPVLQVLPFFALIEVFSRPYLAQLKGMNLPKIARNRVLIMVMINIFLNLILIPTDIKSIGINLFGFGATGAAIATIVSYLVGLIYIRIVTWKLTGISGNLRFLYHASSAIFMSIIIYYLNNIILINRWYHLLVFALLGLSIYFSFLFLFKEINKKDIDFFIETLNIKKMIKYIKREIREK